MINSLKKKVIPNPIKSVEIVPVKSIIKTEYC